MTQHRNHGGSAWVRRLWRDDAGALLATEWVVLATILVLGIIPGYIAVRQGLLEGLVDFANATGNLNQSYSFCGQRLECPGRDRASTLDPRWSDPRIHKGTFNHGFGPPVGPRDSREWDRRWIPAETPGSAYKKPNRSPLQLKGVESGTMPVH
jgi:hypothetical protein